MAERTSVTELLEQGLKVSALRGKTVASNIANLDTPGYRRKAVRFEELLQRVLTGTGQADLRKIQAQVFEPRSTPVSGDGNDVNLDHEIGEMVRNGARYKTYIRLLGKMYKQMEMAIGSQ